jgi:integrator complex subunit 1
MEMCITNNFTASSTLTLTPDQQELQLVAIEKQKILEFETYSAAASSKIVITGSSSLLLSQLTSFDPRGPARRPPSSVIDQLRALNGSFKLGHLLCRSRQPDFLLDILYRQGPAQSMPWLADLVETNEGAWSLLPVPCLCECLLHEAAEDAPGHVSDLLDDLSNSSANAKNAFTSSSSSSSTSDNC